MEHSKNHHGNQQTSCLNVYAVEQSAGKVRVTVFFKICARVSEAMRVFLREQVC